MRIHRVLWANVNMLDVDTAEPCGAGMIDNYYCDECGIKLVRGKSDLTCVESSRFVCPNCNAVYYMYSSAGVPNFGTSGHTPLVKLVYSTGGNVTGTRFGS